jgi:hypothetical protein
VTRNLPAFFTRLGFTILGVSLCATDSQGNEAAQGNAILTRLVRAALPDEYENHKHWGKTTEAPVGLSLVRDGRSLKLKPRTKTVNHGTWRYYRVRLRDPVQSLHLELNNIRQAPDGSVRFDLLAVADVDVYGRMADWRYGIQLISMNAEAHARVRLLAVCDASLLLDPSRLPPDFVFRAKVHDAQVALEHFELDRLSQIRGDLAEELGKELRSLLDDLLADKQQKLVEKMNRQIEKNQDKLRLSLAEATSGMWKDFAKQEPGKQNASTAEESPPLEEEKREAAAKPVAEISDARP